MPESFRHWFCFGIRERIADCGAEICAQQSFGANFLTATQVPVVWKSGPWVVLLVAPESIVSLSFYCFHCRLQDLIRCPVTFPGVCSLSPILFDFACCWGRRWHLCFLLSISLPPNLFSLKAYLHASRENYLVPRRLLLSETC